MSREIYDEICLFFDAVTLGCAMTIIYDFLLIWRNVFSHHAVTVAIEDAVYWLITSAISFLVLYRVNEGVVRWFFVAGAAIGMFLYKESISQYVVKIMSTTISYVVKVLIKIAHIVVAPIKWLFSGIKQLLLLIKKPFIFMKNKLTVCIKLVKMELCKRFRGDTDENVR